MATTHDRQTGPTTTQPEDRTHRKDEPPVRRLSASESEEPTRRLPRVDATSAARQDGTPGGPAAPASQRPAREPQKIAVPERPRLAPGVRLAGQMRESAFKTPPYLIEREGAGYVQVTELLYRIAELCDSRRSLREIAEAVSEKTGRAVSADNVRVLVGTQLVLKGLVPAADGRVVGGQGAARSLLALSLRTKMIGPELLNGPTAVLRWLFWPPVLIATVVLSVLGLGWLLLVHGLAAGARQALYTPGLLLFALGLTAVAAGFHELGHAAALRYGGGQPKGMGVGLYLVYPAFYTDVSDNYRLTRWGRVRTDLGGVFFHLVFVLGILGLYLATGWEVLLVAVPLLLLDAFRQLLPFIRLDGYWTLADLTGVPDFLSHVGAFIRRYLPGQEESAKLPELKWWGTVAFALYIVLVIPILGFMLFTMVRTTPTILATAWDSARQLAGELRQAGGEGNGLGMASAATQIAVLALPIAGLLNSLVRFGKRIALAIWRWSSPTPTRRAIGALGTLGALGLIGYLWAPQLPFGGSGPFYGPTRASFAPIPAEARGTLFDAVGLPQPDWATIGTQADRDVQPAAPSPSPVLPESVSSPVPALPATAEVQATATSAASRTPESAATPTAPAQPPGAPTAAVPIASTPRTVAPAPPIAPAAATAGAPATPAAPAPAVTLPPLATQPPAPAATVVRTPLPTPTRALAP